MACHAKLCSVVMTTLLVFSLLVPLEMGGASPVPTHNNNHHHQDNNKNSLHVHKGNAVRFQQRPHQLSPIPMAAKNQHHHNKQPHVPLPPSNLPLESNTVKKDKLTLSKELQDLLEAKLEQGNTRTPTVYGGYRSKSDRNQSRPTLPYLKGRTTPLYLKDKSRSGSKRTLNMVTTTESSTPPLTTEIATTTEIEEIAVPTTTQVATTTEIEETTTTQSVEVVPGLTTTASPREAMEFAGRKTSSLLQNQLPSMGIAVATPNGRRFYLYPTYEGKVCIFVETGSDFHLTVLPCQEFSEFQIEGCTPVPGHYPSKVCDTTYNGVVCYDYTEVENVCL